MWQLCRRLVIVGLSVPAVVLLQVLLQLGRCCQSHLLQMASSLLLQQGRCGNCAGVQLSGRSARVLFVCSCSQLCTAAEAYLTATMVQTVKMVGASSADGSMPITSDVTGWLGFSSHHLQRWSIVYIQAAVKAGLHKLRRML
jgi:hypothetical protein